MTIKYGVITIAIIVAITLLFVSPSSTYASPSSSKGPTKFRQSLTTLTMGDLPDLELEQTVVEETEEAIIGASVANAAHGVATDASLSSFQQFLQATAPVAAPSTITLDATFSGSGSSGDDEFVIGFNAWTKRVATTSISFNIDITVESTTAAAGTFALTPSVFDSSSNLIAGGSALSFATASLPVTKTAFASAIASTPDYSYTLAIATSDSTGASDVTTKTLFHTGVSGVFSLGAAITGRSVTLTQTTQAGVDGYLYAVLPASSTRPTIASLLTEGSGATVVSVDQTGQQSDTFDLPIAVTAYGEYIIYVVQVSTYASDSINIAIGSQIAVTYVSPCAATPCANSGVCTGTGVSTYTCDCTSTSDYTGTTCTTKIDNCIGASCGNGTCVDGNRTHTCACNTGYSGAACGTNVDDCASSPCQNGGTCLDGIDSFTCRCSSAYTGFLCQVTSSVKCNAAPCLNGATCTNLTVTPYYYCACTSGFVGDSCGTSTTNGTRPTASVRIIQVLSLVLAVADYPSFKTQYAADLVAALGMSPARFSWVYFGLRRTTTSAHGFAAQASDFEAQFDFLAPAAGDNSTTSSLSADALLSSLTTQMKDPQSAFRQSTYGNAVTETVTSCPDGSTTTGTCPLTTTSSTGTTEEESSGSNNNSTWIALGCAVGAFFIILTAFLCYCQKKKPARVVQTQGGQQRGEHELLGGNADLQAAWDEAHPTTFVEMNRTDAVLSQGQQQPRNVH